MRKTIFSFIVLFLVITPIFSLALAFPIEALAAERCGQCTITVDGQTPLRCATDSECPSTSGRRCVRSTNICADCPAREPFYCPGANIWGGYSGGKVTTNTIKEASGLTEEDPRVIVADVINVILGFLGVVAVILILAGGFMWMTAAGNEDKVATAKKLMIAGVVGLVIVLASFGIANFVVNTLLEATK